MTTYNKNCPVCGKSFETTRNYQIYDSKKCNDKNYSTTHKDKRKIYDENRQKKIKSEKELKYELNNYKFNKIDKLSIKFSNKYINIKERSNLKIFKKYLELLPDNIFSYEEAQIFMKANLLSSAKRIINKLFEYEYIIVINSNQFKKTERKIELWEEK